YLIDLDGTMYKGSEPIDAARTFVQELYDQNIPYLFLTNNSTSTPESVAEKLNSMGIHAEPENVFTSSLATAKYIKEQNAEASCFVVGEEGLHTALEAEGLTVGADGVCDYVISG